MYNKRIKMNKNMSQWMTIACSRCLITMIA